jgi:phosphoserine phosphatase RsbU/P
VVKHWIQAHEVLIPLEVLALLVVADVLLPPSLVVTGAFGVAAIVASALTTPTRTAAVGLVAVAMAGVSALWNQNLSTVEWWLRMVVVLTASALGVLLARFRTRQDQELQQMTAIAEAAQRALLPAVPESIGSLGMAARYVSATDEASVGGDLYGVADTSHGIRVIVGDARGKGLDAVQMAATVLAAFRRAAVTETSLAGVAKDLDDVVTAVAEDEDFVTAVLAEFHEDNTVTLVSCGHHPPLLVADSCARRLLDTGPAQPPLGLHPDPWPSTSELAEGARLLFYTDGLVESRDCHGTFFPLEESSGTLTTKDLGRALDGLLAEVADHVGDRVKDDLALLLVERQDGEARQIA